MVACGLAAALRRHGRDAGVTLRRELKVRCSNSSVGVRYGLKRAQPGRLAVTNLAPALQWSTVLSVGGAAAMLRRNHTGRLQLCHGACWQRATACARRAGGSVMLTALRCARARRLSGIDLGQPAA